MSRRSSPRFDLGEKFRTAASQEPGTNYLPTGRSDSGKSTRLEGARPLAFAEDILSPETKSSFAGQCDQESQPMKQYFMEKR